MILSSKDERFRSRVGRKAKYGEFASINSNGGSVALRFSCEVAYKVNLGEKVNLLYDTDTKELIVEKDLNGSVRVTSDGVTAGGKIRNIISSFEFWMKMFGIDAPLGRYCVKVDDRNNIHVYFDKEFIG